MTAAQFAALLAAMLAVAVVPGPSDVLVVARSIASGFVHGAAVTIGIIAADYLLILAAVFSLRVIAENLGPVFVVVKFGCGLYLIGLGIVTWCGRKRAIRVHRDRSARWSASLASGFLITIGDPKAILFYLGLLPAFIDMASATWRQALGVMLAATITIAAVKLSYAYVADVAKCLLEGSRTRVVGNSVGAGALIVIGAYLLVP